jgi:hypothetical protein
MYTFDHNAFCHGSGASQRQIAVAQRRHGPKYATAGGLVWSAAAALPLPLLFGLFGRFALRCGRCCAVFSCRFATEAIIRDKKECNSCLT